MSVDPYAHVPWVDRNGNLVTKDGPYRPVVQPAGDGWTGEETREKDQQVRFESLWANDEVENSFIPSKEK